MTLLAPRREVGEFRQRYKWMALAALAGFGLLVARAVQLQVIDHDHWARIARENITKTITLPATRGIIRDAAGRTIATNEPAYDVYVTPMRFDPDRHLALFAELMGFAEPQRVAFVEKLAQVPARRRAQQVLMFREVSRTQLAALEQHAFELPGVDVVSVPRRVYPYGSIGSHAIGYLNEVSADDIAAREGQGYRAGDLLGRTGIEAAWESYLRGRAGFHRVAVDARGREQEERPEGLSADAMRREPIAGRDLALSLDMDLMRIIERAFRGHPSGGVVVVDVRTGRVRALFSKPSFDLGEMSGRLSPERYAELTESPFRPLIDKTLYESYYPGSTFKPITALAALDAGVANPTHRVDCHGFYEIGNRRFRCSHAHGEVDLRSALVQSCNIYFWKVAEQVGLDRIARVAHDFGFGSPTGIGLNTEAAGFIATREWYEQQQQQFRVGFTLNTAIGQGSTRVTLLQLATMYAAVANGGTLFAPQIVESIHEPDGTLIEELTPRVRRRVAVDRAALTQIVDGLYGAVNDPTGTAFEARVVDGIPVAGKTGTAQVARRPSRGGQDDRRSWYFSRDHAWFAGFAPAGDPEIAIVVLVEHGGGGGKYAAPIATQVVQEYLGGRAAVAEASSASPSPVLTARRPRP